MLRNVEFYCVWIYVIMLYGYVVVVNDFMAVVVIKSKFGDK